MTHHGVTRLRAYLCLMMPFIFETFLAIYSEMPTSDSIRRIIAPVSSCKGGAVPSREWLGGRIDSFAGTLAESEGTIGEVSDKSGARFDSSVVSSTFNRFDGGSSVELSKDSIFWWQTRRVRTGPLYRKLVGFNLISSRAMR